MLTDEEKKILKRIKLGLWLKRLNSFMCFFNFHSPYYKYRELSDDEKAFRRKASVSPDTFMSLTPEHLGYHCRICDLPLGQYRNKRFWFQIKWPR